MITNRLAAALAAGALAVGLLVGSAGAVLVSSATSPDFGASMNQMHADMGSMMDGFEMPGHSGVDMPGHARHPGGQP